MILKLGELAMLALAHPGRAPFSRSRGFRLLRNQLAHLPKGACSSTDL
jgi:hypothetical protein